MTIITTAATTARIMAAVTRHLLCVGRGSEHHAYEAGTDTVPILQVRRLSIVGLNKLPKVPELVSGRVSI